VWGVGIGQDLLRGHLLFEQRYLLLDWTLRGPVQEEVRTRLQQQQQLLQQQLRQQRVRVAALHCEASLAVSIGPKSEVSNLILGEAFWK
jgi:hypothetical protein